MQAAALPQWGGGAGARRVVAAMMETRTALDRRDWEVQEGGGGWESQGEGVGEDRGLGEDRRGEGRAGAGGEGRLGDSWKIQYLLPVV